MRRQKRLHLRRTDRLAVWCPYPKPVVIAVIEPDRFTDPVPDFITDHQANNITIIGAITWSIHGPDSVTSGDRYHAVR